MKRMKYPPQSLLEVWKKNFLKDVAKFTRPTFLQAEDYLSNFTDSDGETWQILGAIENKEMPCLKISTGEVHIWDRWQVSLIKYPKEHEKSERKVEFIFPTKKKASRKKKENEIPPQDENSQLSLFNEK